MNPTTPDLPAAAAAAAAAAQAGAPAPEAAAWHTLPAAEALAALAGDAAGLSDEEAARRLEQSGPNELVDRGAKSMWAILREQLTAVMVLILLVAALLSLALGKYLEAGAILAIVALFAVLGFVQEYRAERAIAALRRMAVPNVRVLRGGVQKEAPAGALVPGDVVLIEAGNSIPADVRILESVNLRIQEAALTGESEAVEKESEALDRADAPLGDRRNMGYLGTQVTYGRGRALVVATGMNTELGRIAELIQSVKQEETPLQAKLDRVGKALALVGVIVAVLVFAIGIWGGEPWTEMILSAISVAVAVIPEGLPAVVTFTLALGAQRMLKRNALIRKLPAVETLGSVTTIASDKTGTLTENRMTMTVADVAGHRLELTEEMRLRQPTLEAGREHPEWLKTQPGEILMLLASGALCNDSSVHREEGTGRLITLGDPTEAALLVAAAQATLTRDSLHMYLPRVAELPFDSERKRMTTVHRRPAGDAGRDAPLAAMLPLAWLPTGAPELSALHGGSDPTTRPFVAITKGSPDGLLEISTHAWENGSLRPLDSAMRQRIEAANAGMARNGMRVLGFAFRTLADPDAQQAEQRMVFLGLVGLIDPPRPEVRDAVRTCIAAGIRPVMITGDHPLTAAAIARELGISHDDTVITGAELAKMDDAALAAAVERTAVFARVSPEHKLRIVGALQDRGQVVAMTGDGVNDAPALKKADIGVAMGITGTDVSKEAASMVLRDDNFATIVAAVEEGRVIYDNLRRFVRFAVAGNVGKIMVMVLWPLLVIAIGHDLGSGAEAVALLPLQLLWLNLMTDGLLGLSMGAELPESDVMQRKPNNVSEGIFSGAVWQTTWIGLFIGTVALAVGLWYDYVGLPQWQTMMFNTLAFLQLFQAIGSRSERESVFTVGLFSNRVMNITAAAVILLQLVAIYTPVLNTQFLGLVPLAWQDFLISAGLGAALLAVMEAAKAVRRAGE